jgi:hypothetical protein
MWQYFKRLADQTFQAKQWTKITAISDEVQDASYIIAKVMAKKMKSHTTAESVILPACCKILNIMFGKEYEEEILKIPKSNNTVSQHIQDMIQDAELQVITHIKEADFFAIQLDESTDITGKAQLIAFSRTDCNGAITEQFLFCKPLPETTKGQDILNAVDSYLWQISKAVDICQS